MTAESAENAESRKINHGEHGEHRVFKINHGVPGESSFKISVGFVNSVVKSLSSRRFTFGF
jgi:hypothetical protein